MQAISRPQTIRRGGAQLLLVALVAALGISFGRWVVPADDSGPRTQEPRAVIVTAPAATGSDEVIGRKLAQMDALDAAHGTTVAATTTGSDDLIDRKLAQMDALDAAYGTTVPAATTGPDDLIDRKLAQMDALDAR